MHVAAINDGGASSRSVKVLLELAPPRAIILGGWWRARKVVDGTAVAPAEQGWVVDLWDGLVGSRRGDGSLHGHGIFLLMFVIGTSGILGGMFGTKKLQ